MGAKMVVFLLCWMFLFTRVYHGGDPRQWEFPTLRLLEEFCEQVPEGRALYFHSKGASKELVGVTATLLFSIRGVSWLCTGVVLLQ